MIVAVVKSNKIIKTFLPDEVNGDYVLKDNYGNLIGNVVGTDGKWIFHANKGYQVSSLQGDPVSALVDNYVQFGVKSLTDETNALIYAYPNYENEINEYAIKKNKITIGSSNTDITYSSQFIKQHQATITYDKNHWYIESTDYGVYVNDRLIKRKRLDHGDIIFIYGLKIMCMSNFIVLINLVKQNNLTVSGDSLEKLSLQQQQLNEQALNLESEKEVYEENEYFLRSPRFKTSVEHKDINISPPPEAEQENIKPTILIIGPQLTMLLSSFITLYNTVTRVASGETTIGKVMPNIILVVVMMISTFLWPALTRKFDARTRKKNELKRVKLYRKYLTKKEKEINDIIQEQKQILLENNVTLENCQQIIYQRKRNLWEKTYEDSDYLTVRVGTGFVKPDISINYTEEEFTMIDDFLKDELKDLIKKYDYVEETPLNLSLIENRVTAVIGNYGILQKFMESILLQIMTFHIYDELKIMIFTDENKVNDWNYVKFLPHCWDNQKETRFIASNITEKKKLSSYIENIIKEREEAITKGKNEEVKINSDEYKKYKPYYLIITDNINECRNLEGIKKVLEMKGNLGFSLLIKHDRIANLPNQCTTFINVTEDVSGIFKNELQEQNQQQFKADLNKTINVEDCVQRIANIPVKIPREKHELPKSIGFLEMYDIGNVEQFNSIERWKNNNPVVSLSVPVGIDQAGELFNMDIHEKAYGPHGLVAGTTGSGKSEWIITYILSLAVNFDPNEVQFVLIDYKGGGLAGSFVNEETGMRLPHLVGTITNLDKSEIRRSLASIESESKRRQRLFNEAREKLNDSSMNIYKYQQYYRKGMLDEPLSHLFIISDEFAELKAQEPEFLEQLVSIARIGRSLGIHLILATQKPSGVVDEQMWSNSRFKVCLRVQDKSDSNEMLKCDDAAFLKQTGAFYLQVGMNEFFGLGQSAYAGVKYKPTNIVKKKIETSLDVLNQTGEVVNTVDYIVQTGEAQTEAHGEELLNIILYLSELAKRQNIKPRKLWLDSIPETIYVDQLKQKYGFKRTPFLIEPILGELDDPYQQKQSLLKLRLNETNMFITGLSGSGKEKLLQSIIYSIITNYTPQEVNLYIADFGAETLTMFKDAPHVGDIVYINNKDKVENMFRFVKREYKDRKKRYREFGGSFESYNKYSEQKDPILTFVINSYETLKEEYMDIMDTLPKLYIECAKYGIIFILSSVDTQVLRGKEAGAFGHVIALKVNNDDYSMILGKAAKDIIPKDLKGRGLIEIDKVVYEFQTASICEENKLQQAMKQICTTLANGYKMKVPPIPMIPPALNMDVIPTDKLSINSVIDGYLKATIQPHYVDLQKNFGTVIIGVKKSEVTDYCRVLYRQLDIVAENTKVYLFDSANLYRPERYKNITYVNSEEIYNTLKNLIIYVNGEKEKYEALEDKSQYKAKARSLIVFHQMSELYRVFGDLKGQLSKVIEISRELELFDFVISDTSMDFKDIYREQAMQKILLEANGVLIGNSYDNQIFIELSSRDIRQKDALPEHQGYIIEKGKGYLAQVLRTESFVADEEDL